MANAGRVIILAGAPEATSLEWDETALQSDYDEAVERFVSGKKPDFEQQHEQDLTQTPHLPKWRSITVSESTDDDQRSQVPSKTKHKDKSKNQVPAADSQDFLEHSFAFLEKLQSSQILPTNLDSTTIPSDPSFSTNGSTSFPSTFPSFHERPTGESGTLNTAVTLTDMRRAPNAAHISSIQPQTMTVNLLVAIIAVSPARTVSLRRRKGEMDIVELTVGDETRAGFGVSFWLPSMNESLRQTRQQRQQQETNAPLEGSLRRKLQRLRPGDVVLLSNVALSTFRGQVFGQSLAVRRFGGWATTVDVVEEGMTQASWEPSFKTKLGRLREWRDMFVGTAPQVSDRGERKTGSMKRKVDKLLPPDTQD